MHVCLDGSTVEVEERSNLLYRKVVVVPQGEHGELTLRKTVQRGRQTLTNLFCEVGFIGGWRTGNRLIQDLLRLVGRSAASPKLPTAAAQAIEASIHGDSREPLGRLGWTFDSGFV